MFYIFKNFETMSVLHQNGVEFHQEFNGHGPRHMTRVIHVSDTFFSFWYGRLF